jgi:hypothetical protein
MPKSTSGTVLTPAGRRRLAEYVEAGGGFAGVHAAACTEYDWPYCGELLGARFDRHPAYQPGKAVVADPGHPATRHLPAVWDFTDEWYDFRPGPRGRGGCSTRPSGTPPRRTATRTSWPTSAAASPGRDGSPSDVSAVNPFRQRGE